jgi:Fe-S-cluster containining protein
MSNPCATCSTRCCHRYVVPVSGYDVYRIATGLHLAPEQFLVTVPQPEPTPYSFRLSGSTDTYELALDKSPSRAENKPCVFWLPVGGGAGRCGIHPYRPYACQVYPATLEDAGMVRREDVICPAQAWRDDTFEAPIWRRQYLRMQSESDIYQLTVARWNHHFEHGPQQEALGLPTYLAYLMGLYEQLRPILFSLSEGEWDQLSEGWNAAIGEGESPMLGDVPPQLERWSDFFWAIYNTAAAAFDDGFA